MQLNYYIKLIEHNLGRKRYVKIFLYKTVSLKLKCLKALNIIDLMASKQEDKSGQKTDE